MELQTRSGAVAVEERGGEAEALRIEKPEERPCFFHGECGGTAEIEKQGKAVCRPCAMRIKGVEYPLRAPSREPLYPVPEELERQLGMHAGKARRGAER